MPKIRVLFRFEQDEHNGCWYNNDSKYHCSDPDLKKHPMPSEPDIYKGIYSSACGTLEELLWWIPPEVAKRLVAQGCKFVKYTSDDYFERDHGEICFNKLTFIKREVLEVAL